MKIYIEVLIPLIIGIIFFVWFIWFSISKKWSERRYKPENDRGKIGEEHRKELIKEGRPDPSGRIANTIVSDNVPVESIGRQGELEGRDDISTTNVDSNGEDSTSVRKKPTRRGIFRRKWIRHT